MRRVIPIILALLLVLGWAGMAQGADLSYSGWVQTRAWLEAGSGFDWDWYCCWPLAWDINLTVSQDFGPASVDVSFGPIWEYYLGVTEANFTYRFNNHFALGLTYSGEDYYADWGGYGHQYYTPAIFEAQDDLDYYNHLTEETMFVKASLDFNKGSAQIYWDPEDGEVYGAGQCTISPVTFGGSFYFCPWCGHLDFFDLYADYQVTNNLKLTGELLYPDDDPKFAIGALYTGNRYTVGGDLRVDSGDGLYFASVKGTYEVTSALTVVAVFNYDPGDYYDDDYADGGYSTYEGAGVSIGATYALGEDLTMRADFNLSKQAFRFDLSYAF